MKILIAKATHKQLNYLVAEYEGLRPIIRSRGIEVLFPGAPRRVPFAPATDWSHGGPIIERENITTGPWTTSPAMAHYGTHDTVTSSNPRMVGNSLLVAAMRCYMASKIGDEVDIPEELA